MKQHWKILLWMLAGVIVGGLFQVLFDAPADAGLSLEAKGEAVRITKIAGPAKKSKLASGDRLLTVIRQKGRSGLEKRVSVQGTASVDRAIQESAVGDVLWFVVGEDESSGREVPITLGMRADAPRAVWIEPFAFGARLFMALLKMLIVPLVLTSIIAGVAGVGGAGDLRRLGLKTFAYYITTSLFAILIGQLLVNLLRPGEGAELGLPPSDKLAQQQSEPFYEVFYRMVPQNLFDSLSSNGAMLSIIFFGLIFGLAITKAKAPHKERVQGFFESSFQVMMELAGIVLKLIPYGVFCLLVRVVGETGFGLFEPLAIYCLTIVSGLFIHCVIILPLILKFVAKVSPIAWAKAMSPALLTAFSTSSSGMTLPVTLESVEERGKVSNRVSSFVLPLGATINMDGTALYEIVGVIFLAQYYASTGDYTLTMGAQLQVVMLALFASIGTAAIPSAGLVMMLTILSALHLPLEGAALILAVDRPLDMLRTVTNVWSDSCGCAVVAKSEGEQALAEPAAG